MKKLDAEIVFSFVVRVALLTVLFFAAAYFFIGKNLPYMAKTQNQLNREIVALFKRDVPGGASDTDNISQALQTARENNVGISITYKNGAKIQQDIDDNMSILRLEFGGRLVSRKFTGGDRVQVVLNYFRPFPAGDDMVRFFPAFWRLAVMFAGLALVYAWVAAMASANLIKNDLRQVKSLTSNLVKGSFRNTAYTAGISEFAGLLKDLGELREILWKKEQLKKRMTADFAHELRTPLTTLQSHLEALIDGVWAPSTERFVSCHEEILRLIRLVGDLEKLSKVEDANIIIEKSVFDLTELAKNMCLNFQGELSHKNITLALNGNRQDLIADKDKISQVLVNLISNSLKHTAEKGRIMVDIKGDKDYAYLVINDSGSGIPSKDIPNVFNRLYRSDASRARMTGGAGIGLTVARAIVEAHRGSIDIVSQEGLGTEVTVIFPRK